MSELERLATLIRQRNAIDNQLSTIIGRPPHSGHIGEYVAAAIFGIELNSGANVKAIDGHFHDGPLAGRSVNIKYGTRRDGMLNLVHSSDPVHHPDYYLVLTGPLATTFTSVGLTAPWVVHAVYLFESHALVGYLTKLGRTPGVATSVRKLLWESAMIYPDATNPTLTVTAAQRAMLALFSGDNMPA